MQATRIRINRRACKAGSYPPAVDDSHEVQRSPYGRFSEREINDTDFLRLLESQVGFYRQAILGKNVLRQAIWVRGRIGSGLYSESRALRKATRADVIARSLTIAPYGGFHQNTCSAGGV